MLKKSLSIAFLIIMFVISSIFFIPHKKLLQVNDIHTSTEFILNNTKHTIPDIEAFDPYFSIKNKNLALNLNISEEEAFILGNLSKYWAENLLKNRFVYINKDFDLIYLKYSYKERFKHSGFCLINSKPYLNDLFEIRLKELRRAKYQLVDLDTGKYYPITPNNANNIKNFVILRKSHLLKQNTENNINFNVKDSIQLDKIQVYLTDSTSKTKLDKNCSANICKQILKQINNANKSIDIAIYGYSEVPEIETALINAINRGVKIRLIYDENAQKKNIYPNTDKILSIITNNKSDYSSGENQNIMHNKFYIFDDRILITGSANLSDTDMSGFNSNSIIILDSQEIALTYKKEFEQMYNNKFHNSKESIQNKPITISGAEFRVYFSPQDKPIANAILPIIKNAKNYIYIPTFVLTDDNVTKELINAHKRGVEIKIIIDALNASIKRSKHNQLRHAGIAVKTENYAGKMHSKSMIVDDQYTIIGSMNFSNSGENKNDENLVLIKNPDITKFYKNFFLYQWAKIDDKYLKFNVRAESKESIGSCFDGIDNNYDGLIDKNDPACK